MMTSQSAKSIYVLLLVTLSIGWPGVLGRSTDWALLDSADSGSSASSSSGEGFAANQTEVGTVLRSAVSGSSPIPKNWDVVAGGLFRGSWSGVSIVNGSDTSALFNASTPLLRIDFVSLFAEGYFQNGTIRLDLLGERFPLISINASNASGVVPSGLKMIINASLPGLLQSLDLQGVRTLRSMSSFGPTYLALNSLPSNLSYFDLSQCQLEGVVDLTGIAFPVLQSPSSLPSTTFPIGAVFNLSGNLLSGAVDLTLLPLQQQLRSSGAARIPVNIIDLRNNPQLLTAFVSGEGRSALFTTNGAALESPYGVGILLDSSIPLQVQPTVESFPFPTPLEIYCLVNSTSEIVHMLRLERAPTRVDSEGTTIPEPTFLRMINAETFQECNFTLAASLTFPVTGYIVQSTVFGTVMKGCVPDGVLYARQAPSISPQIDLVMSDGNVVSYGQCPQPVFLDHSGQYYSFSPNNTNSSTALNLAVKYFSDFDNQGGNVTARGITSALNGSVNGGRGVARNAALLWPVFFNPNSTVAQPTAANSLGVFRYFNQKLLFNRLNVSFPIVDDNLSSVPASSPWSEVLYSPDSNGTRSTGAVYLRNDENQTATYYQYYYGPVSSVTYIYPGDITYFSLQNTDGLVNLTFRVYGTNPIANLTPGTTKSCTFLGVLQYLTPKPTKASIESERQLAYSSDLIRALSPCLPTIVNGTTISPEDWTSAYYKLDSLDQFRSEGSLYFENSGLPPPTKSIVFSSKKQVGLWPPTTVCADVGYPYNGRMNITFDASGDFKIALYNVSKYFSELRICTGTAVLWYRIDTQEVLLTNASQKIFSECFPIGTETTSLSPPFTAGSFQVGQGGIELSLQDRLGVRLRLTEANCELSTSNPYPATLQLCDSLNGVQTNSTWMAESFLGEEPLRNGVWHPGIGPAIVKWNSGTAPAFFCQNWEEFMNNSTRIRQRLADLCYESLQCTIDIASCYSVANYIGSLAGCYLGKGYQLPDLILPSLPPGWEFDGETIRSMGQCPSSDPPYAQALLVNTLNMLVGHNITLLVQCTSADGEDAILRVCPNTVVAGIGPFFDVDTFPVLVTKAAAGFHDEINLDLRCSVCTSYIGIHAYPLPLGLIAISSAMSVIFILLANALDPVVKPAIIAFRIRMSSIGLLLSSKERQFYEDRLQALVRPAVHDADFVLSHAEKVCERVEHLYRERLQRVRENPRDWAINEDASSYVFVDTGRKANPNTELNQPAGPAGEPSPTSLPLRGGNFHSYSTTGDVVNTSLTGRPPGVPGGRGEETELGTIPTPSAQGVGQTTKIENNIPNGNEQVQPAGLEIPTRKPRSRPKAESDDTSTVREPDRDEMAFPSEKKDGEKLFNVALRSVLHASYRLVPQLTLLTLDNGNDPVLCDLMDLREACEGAALYFKQLRDAEAAERRARRASKKAGRGQNEEDPGAALLGNGPITRTSAATSYHTAVTVDDRRQSHATSVAPSVKSSSNGLTPPRSSSIYTASSGARSRKSSRSRASTNRGGFLQAVEDANYAANQQIDGFSIRTLKSSLVKAPIAQLMDSLQATQESFILIEDYVAWKYLVPKLWYINVQLLLVWIYFFFCLSNALDKDSGVDSTSSRYALVYFLFLNSSIPGSLLVNLLYRRLALYQENEQLLQDIFDMVRSMLTNRYFLCAIAVVLPPLFSHIIVGLIIFCPITFGVVAVLGILRKLVSRLPVPEPKEDKSGVHFCHRFNWLIILAHLTYRAFVTLCTVFLLQVGFNYALLKIYRGASADWPSVIEFDWTSRSLYCSALQYEKSGITFYQHILNTFLP